MKQVTPDELREVVATNPLMQWRVTNAADQMEETTDTKFVTFFPWGNFKPSGGYTCYGPFNSYDEAAAHARTLSSDPNEGEVAELRSPEKATG